MEALIALLLMVTIMGISWAFMVSVGQQTARAQSTSSAAQAGYLLLHALQDDLANLIPAESWTDTMKIDGNEAQGQISLLLQRRPDAIEWDGQGIHDERVREVRYLAEKMPSGLFRVLRIVEDREIFRFEGVHARALRFHHVTVASRVHYLRVSLLLMAEDVDVDGLKAANAPQPVFFSTLMRIPMRPGNPLG